MGSDDFVLASLTPSPFNALNIQKKKDFLNYKTPFYKKIYCDLTGLDLPVKIVIPGGYVLISADLSLGYMITEKFGIGASYGFGVETDIDAPDSYSGVTLQGRWKKKRFQTVMDVGLVTGYSIIYNDHPYFLEVFDKPKGPILKVKQFFLITRHLTTGLHLHLCPPVKVLHQSYVDNIIVGESTRPAYLVFSIFLGVSFN